LLRKRAKLTYSHEEFTNFSGEDPRLQGRGEDGMGREGMEGMKRGGEDSSKTGEERGGKDGTLGFR